MSAAVLRVDGLAKAFGGIDAVRDVSFAVSAGELVAPLRRLVRWRSRQTAPVRVAG
jgi:hypothetical protein